MATLADSTWVKYWLDLDNVHVLDPRPPLEYRSGHLPGAVNVPLELLLDERGALLPDHALASVFGEAGVDESKRSLVYDGADGRRGALMAWTLEYLGRGEVSLCALLYEGWAKQGYPVSTIPKTPTPCEFNLNINPNKRASLDELDSPNPPKLIDLRRAEEFNSSPLRHSCESRNPRRGGAGTGIPFPNASNLPWTEYLGDDHMLLRPDNDLARQLRNIGVGRMDKVVTYSTTGARAAIGYLALKRAGYDVRILPNLLYPPSIANKCSSQY